MKITKEEDYGILLIQALAYPVGKKYVPLSEIATKYKLSEFFLKRVAKKLKKAGLIKSKEGFAGGYVLAKPSVLISYGEILNAISGPIDISPCCVKCSKKTCQPRLIWNNINEKLNELLNSIKITSC